MLQHARHLLKTGLLFAGSLLLCNPLVASAQRVAEMPQLIVMSAVSDDPQSLISTMRPMASYMSKKLAPLGISNVDILIAENHEQMVRFIRDGRVDWITETAYSAALLEQSAGAEIILRKWKQGVPSYHSVVFVRKDSGIESLDQLTGRSVAFQHPGSTTGYFVPRSFMQAQGLRLRSLRTVRESPRPDFVNFLFSGAEYNSAMWVDKGLVSAAVLSNLDWQREQIIPAAIRENLRIIYTSASLPRAVELLRGDLNPTIKSAIKEALISAHDDPDAKEALQAYQMTLRFDELDSSDLNALREIRDSLRESAAPISDAP